MEDNTSWENVDMAMNMVGTKNKLEEDNYYYIVFVKALHAAWYISTHYLAIHA